MKVLIAGGAGFIGSHICLRFINKGHEVICLDNLSTGPKRNMLEYLYNPLFHFVIHDVTEPFPAANVDLVIHCAIPDLRDPLHFLKTCAYGAFNVAGMARRNNAPLVCITGSSIYGESISEAPISEDAAIVNYIEAGRTGDVTTSCAGHQIVETILNNYKTIDARILRVFEAYGPRMSDSSLIKQIIEKAIENKPIKLDYPEELVLGSCFVSDVVDAICCAASLEKHLFMGPINLGAADTITLGELIKAVVEAAKSRSRVSFGEKPMPAVNLPDIERAAKILNLEAENRLREGN